MTTKIKILIVICLLVAVSVVVFGIYYTFFQFNQKDVKDYINEEVANHPQEKQAGVYKIISDGVANILSERQLVKQVLEQSKLTGTPKEMELVHAAIMQAKSYGYLN